MHQFRQYLKAELSGLYSDLEIRNLFFQIMEHLTGGTHAEILANKYSDLSDTQIKEFESILVRLKKSEPIQYVLGVSYFYGLDFMVRKGVLIPRPETEELVDWIIKDVKDNSNIKVLDIGTGSGCIAISLARNLHLNGIVAYDVSEEALCIAKENAEKNNIKLDLQLVDILQRSQEKLEEFDVIVSNPPYIRELEKADMEANVLDYEPDTALFVTNRDPLVFYRHIAQFAMINLKKGGLLYFEINQAFGQATVDLLSKLGFVNIKLRKDCYGKDRMIKAERI